MSQQCCTASGHAIGKDRSHALLQTLQRDVVVLPAESDAIGRGTVHPRQGQSKRTQTGAELSAMVNDLVEALVAEVGEAVAGEKNSVAPLKPA